MLGGPGARDNDARLAPYLDIDAKGLLVVLSGDLDCILAETINGLRCFINEGVPGIVKGRMMACMKHFRKLGQVIDVIRGAHRGLNLRKPSEKLSCEKRRWDCVNRHSTAFGINAGYRYKVYLGHPSH